ncbi:facilitated trehalose transporter Tret1-like [Ceratina calcarata]|uniref:Facilitated trehalose transporter Tret1-like n=1 Tax=Ceratina calcarata TaxID=156304 RepID=A0AAJ7N669_9HYME|nr:facilitated trehalose transporter Tret1-like [Ceratina calcarata]
MANTESHVGPDLRISTIKEKPIEETTETIKTLDQKGTEVKSKIYVQLISAVIVNFTLISAGMMFTWSAVSLVKLEDPKSDIHLTTDQGGWLATILLIGACFGPSASLLLLDRIGRKWFLYGLSVPTVFCWVLIYFADRWEWILVARFFGGIPLGAIYAMVPVYLGELVETRIRGAAGAMMVLSLNIGFMIIFAVGPKVDRKTLSLICLVPTAVYLVSAPWIPDSPYYYLKKGKTKCASLTLALLRRKEDNTSEIKDMHKLIEEEKTGGIKELFRNPTSRKGFLLLLLLLAGQQLCGSTAIQAYYISIIEDMHIIWLDTYYALLIINGINVVSSIISTVLVDKLGRKPVYIVSSIGTSFCLFALGAYFLLQHFGIDVKAFSLVPLIVILIYTILFSFGVAQIPAIVQSEIFPINVKSWASTLANTYGSVLGMLVTKIFQLMVDGWGYHVVYLTLAVMELIVAITVIVIMPETKQKSFAEIQELLKNGSNKKRIVQ